MRALAPALARRRVDQPERGVVTMRDGDLVCRDERAVGRPVADRDPALQAAR
jgi:hypothetical protein